MAGGVAGLIRYFSRAFFGRVGGLVGTLFDGFGRLGRAFFNGACGVLPGILQILPGALLCGRKTCGREEARKAKGTRR